jgi:hypothetical protein
MASIHKLRAQFTNEKQTPSPEPNNKNQPTEFPASEIGFTALTEPNSPDDPEIVERGVDEIELSEHSGEIEESLDVKPEIVERKVDEIELSEHSNEIEETLDVKPEIVEREIDEIEVNEHSDETEETLDLQPEIVERKVDEIEVSERSNEIEQPLDVQPEMLLETTDLRAIFIEENGSDELIEPVEVKILESGSEAEVADDGLDDLEQLLAELALDPQPDTIELA